MSNVIRFFKLNRLPTTTTPNAIYFIKTLLNKFKLYVSDNNGNLLELDNSILNSNQPIFDVYSGFPPKPPGINDYVIPYVIGSTSLTSLTLTTNRIYWIPFVVKNPVNITEIAINITTASGGNHEIGIYNTNNLLEPNELIFSTTFNVGISGIRNYIFPIPLFLQTGIYWFAWLTRSNPTVRAVPVASCKSYGSPSLGTGNITGWLTTASGSLPSRAPTTGYMNYTSTLPAIGVRYNFA
ncbi:MAG: hypothetical protein QXX12_01865 [Nanopusillaceae archaeon]